MDTPRRRVRTASCLATGSFRWIGLLGSRRRNAYASASSTPPPPPPPPRPGKKRKATDSLSSSSHYGAKKMRGREDALVAAPTRPTSSETKEAAEALLLESDICWRKTGGGKDASVPSGCTFSETSSKAVSPPRPANKRKAGELLPSQSNSRGKRKRGGEKVLRFAVTLDAIRGLPSSAMRPFYPRILRRGTRSFREPKAWRCPAPDCGFVNGLTHHLLFDLPAFKCRACGAAPPKGAADFGFCYADMGMNEVCPIGNVKDQEGDTCMANAVTSSVEISNRVMSVILDQCPTNGGPYIDVNDLLKKYHRRYKDAGSRRCRRKYNLRSLVGMLKVLTDEGIKDMNDSAKVYKISDWGLIPQNDFVSICSALADGYALIAGFLCGKRIYHLQPGEVYVPPLIDSVSSDGETKPEGHMVVLVGAMQEKNVRFFHFLNSWDLDFCKRSIEDGDGIRGGVGAVVAEGLVFPPVQILRFNEREDQAVKHFA